MKKREIDVVEEREIDVVVAGHICIDLIPKFSKGTESKIEKLFSPGKLINVEEAAISTGGPVSNTGLALHRLGLRVELMGKVGNDFFGKAILERLKEDIPGEGMRVVEGEVSSYTIALSPPGMDRMFLHNPGANDTFGFKDINFDLVSQAKLFHLGYPPLMRRLYEKEGAELAKIFKKVKELGTTTSLDVALPDPNSPSGKVSWETIFENTLPYVDIFLPSAEEALFMLEREQFFKIQDNILGQLDGGDLTHLAGRMINYGVKVAGIKCGYRGLYLRTADEEKLSRMGYARPEDLDSWASRELWEPTYHVSEVVSATGSGDSAIAGFLAAYLRGETIELALKMGCAAGAQNVQVLDAVSGIRSWEETTRQLKEGWAKDKLEIKTSGWRFDDQDEVWKGPNDKELTNKKSVLL